MRENYTATNSGIVKSKPFSQMTGRFLHLVYMVGHVCFHYSVVSNEYICLDYEELKIIVNILWLLKGQVKYLSEYTDICIHIFSTRKCGVFLWKASSM